MPVVLNMRRVVSHLSAFWSCDCLVSIDAMSWPDPRGVSLAPLAHMCMDPATFMPDKALHFLCHSSNSEDPAVEADCPEDCESHSWLDEVDGAMKYGCHCEVSSAEECADKYPGEHMPHRPRT